MKKESLSTLARSKGPRSGNSKVLMCPTLAGSSLRGMGGLLSVSVQVA